MRPEDRVEILLAHAYYLARDPAERRVLKPYVPLGILSLAAYLEREGHRTAVFDSTFETPEAFAGECRTLRPPLVGISVNMMTRGNAVGMIAVAREAGARVIVGGPEPALYPEEFLAAGADVVVVGEGERTLLELVTFFAAGNGSPGTINGIVFMENGHPVRTPPRAHLDHLDMLPLPARDKVDLHRYMSVWRKAHGHCSLSVSTMRGCPYTCAWCSHAVYGESYRRRSPSAVVAELEMLQRAYSPDRFWFADDVFTINTRWIREFQRELYTRGMMIAYECITRADRFDEETARILSATGCKRLWIGSESGSQRILDRMSRGVTVEQITKAALLAQGSGIEVGFFLMLGYESETREDIEATIEHVRRCHPDIVLTTVSYPIKGTRYYEEMRGRMRIPTLPFALWNDRMISVDGRASRWFYWFAHRRVINEAALARFRRRGFPPAAGARLQAIVKANVARIAMNILR